MRITYRDTALEFDPAKDLTVQRLRQLKQVLGPDYGKFVTLMRLVAEGDVDALVGIIWVAKSANGEKLDLRNFANSPFENFSVGDVQFALEDTPEEGEDPLASRTDLDPSSTPIPTS